MNQNSQEERTAPLGRLRAAPDQARRFALDVQAVDGTVTCWESTADHCSIGSHASNEVVLDDPAVSRFHCEITIAAEGARIRDLQSRNSTFVDGVEIEQAFLRDGSTLRLGQTAVRFRIKNECNVLPLSKRTSFGELVGVSPAMRSVYAMLERAADSDSIVLLEGETGTGKEVAAASIMSESRRCGGPYVIVDCGSIAASLIESELFGHERGAFTGALRARDGAFAEAHGGTIFLDEIGELSLDLQPKLLRVLEQRQVRRIGASAFKPIDVRIIAATNRDLRTEVNRNRFRADLYYRLAVLRVRLPPLRERPEDIPAMTERLVAALNPAPAISRMIQEPEFLARLQRSTWPGNVRELRNYLERCVICQSEMPFLFESQPNESRFDDPTAGSPKGTRSPVGPETEGIANRSERAQGAGPVAPSSFFEARAQWERGYVSSLMEAHGGRVEDAARAAGVARAHFYRLLARHRANVPPRCSPRIN